MLGIKDPHSFACLVHLFATWSLENFLWLTFFCFQQCGEIEKLHMGVELLHKNHVLELLCVIEAVALSNNTFTRTLTLDTTLNYVNELMCTG